MTTKNAEHIAEEIPTALESPPLAIEYRDFNTIGNINGLAFVALGFANGARINDVTGAGVIVAFGTDKLLSVAKALRADYPSIDIYICADNEPWEMGNPGVKLAKEAAAAVNGKHIIPAFRDLSTKPTNFADLYILEGWQAVYEQISAVVMAANVSERSDSSTVRLATLATLAGSKANISADPAWPEPAPLMRVIAPAQSFPIDVLPSTMQGAALKMLEVIQAPDAIVGQSLLATATLAAQPHTDISIDGRRRPLSSFFITIGESGERKSACDEIAGRIIKDKQRQLSQEFVELSAGIEKELAEWEKMRAKICSSDLSDDENKAALMALGSPPKLVNPMIITEDPTFPALIKALREGQFSMGLFSDEGGRFLGGVAMSRDNLANTVTGLSKLWDGGPITITRSGEGNHILYGRRFSMHIMIQPIIASRTFSDPLLLNQGFLSRCLCSFPNSTIGDRPYVAYDLTSDADIIKYHTAIACLMERPYPYYQPIEMGLDPNPLTLEEKAKAAWIKFHDYVEKLQRDGGKLQTIKGFASKAAEHALRISGALAIYECPDCLNITINQLDAGIEITNFYLGEALRLFETSRDNPDLKLAESVLSWAQQQGSILSLVDLYQYGPNAVRDKATAKKMVGLLEDAGWVRKITGSHIINGKTRRDVWRVWPG